MAGILIKPSDFFWIGSRVLHQKKYRTGTDTPPESPPPTTVPGPLQPVHAFRTGDGHRPAVQEKKRDAVRRRGRGPPKKRRGGPRTEPPAAWRGGQRGDCSPSRGTCPAV
ncbi:unnamed protein product [Pleuronectes platessa]|uniref:Uncharacterized protein n=1 Tax=Pleuronectes platessa TaxID=8262 RepID=A0A9N7YUD3_PLEPL|nr:unnamed protein product [Pleuronectes platessa]